MAILDFLSDCGKGTLKDFWKLNNHDIPSSPGVYVLITRGDIHFHYPLGKSPVFYIGQSKNLRSRLYSHLKLAKEARDNRKEYLYWPRYEFTAVYAGRYCFIQTWQGMTARALEEEVLARFARKYHSFPIANGQGSWNRINRVMEMD